MGEEPNGFPGDDSEEVDHSKLWDGCIYAVSPTGEAYQRTGDGWLVVYVVQNRGKK